MDYYARYEDFQFGLCLPGVGGPSSSTTVAFGGMATGSGRAKSWPPAAIGRPSGSVESGISTGGSGSMSFSSRFAGGSAKGGGFSASAVLSLPRVALHQTMAPATRSKARST